MELRGGDGKVCRRGDPGRKKSMGEGGDGDRVEPSQLESEPERPYHRITFVWQEPLNLGLVIPDVSVETVLFPKKLH